MNNKKIIAAKTEKIVQVDYYHYFIEHGGFFPVIVKNDGKAYIFCRTNAGHLGRYGQISLLESPNGIDWFNNGAVAKSDYDIRNPSAYIFPNGEMLLAAFKYDVYKSNNICSPSEMKKENSLDLILFHSKNKGNSWLKKENVNLNNVYNEIGKVSPHGKMLIYNNQLLMPVYNKKGAYLLASNDQGSKWTVFSQISLDFMEPVIVKTAEGNLIAVMRSKPNSLFGEASFISHYENNNWSHPVQITESFQHPADLLLLTNNMLLLTYSDRTIDNQRILVKTSKDNGKHWSNSIQIGPSFKNCDFGYPSTIELTNGMLTTVFYANPYSKNPYFYFNNPDLYNTMNARGIFYGYSTVNIINQ